MLMVNATIEDNNEIEASIENNEEIIGQVSANLVASDDYNTLKHLPTLDGRVIKGNINELDPTVPSWAKETNKPSYSAEEIGALNEDDAIPLSDIASLFD